MADNKYTAREILDSLGDYSDTNTYKSPHLYAPDKYTYGGFNLPSHAAGGYHRPTHSIGFKQGFGNSADLLAHETMHYDTAQRNKDLGHEKSMYMPSMYPNDRRFRDRTEILNTLKATIRDHYTNKYGLETDGNRFRVGDKTSKDFPDIPANWLTSDEEVVAGLRGLHGSSKPGTTFWDTDDGKIIKEKLDSSGDKEKTRKILDSLMFPQTRFLDEAPPESLLDRMKRFLNRR
jgi:hypothetical protein